MRATDAQLLHGEGGLPIFAVFFVTAHCEEGLFFFFFFSDSLVVHILFLELQRLVLGSRHRGLI